MTRRMMRSPAFWVAITVWAFGVHVLVLNPLTERGLPLPTPPPPEWALSLATGLFGPYLMLIAEVASTWFAAYRLRLRGGWQVVIAGIALLIGLQIVSGQFEWSARARFVSHHKEYADLVEAWWRREPGGSAYLGRLPTGYEHLTTKGYYTATEEGGLFLPLWMGLPDDAGGFWFMEKGSPEGEDMLGMPCRNPVDLGNGWWSCGVR